MTERHTYTIGYVGRLSSDKRKITELTVVPDAPLPVLVRTSGHNQADLIGACVIRLDPDSDRILADVTLLPDAPRRPIGWPILTIDTKSSRLRPRWPIDPETGAEVMAGDPEYVEIQAVAAGCMFSLEPAWPDLLNEVPVAIADEPEGDD